MPELSFDLMNTDENLDKFISDITTPIISNNFSLLVSGPIGCGKEVFVRKLMEAIGCKYKIYSILDFDSSLTMVDEDKKKHMYHLDQIVDICEKNNQGCVFENIDYALSNKDRDYTHINKVALIILDEAEEILRDRSDSDIQPWKNDMANAFLTNLENTKYPIVCTTNFIDKIDKAILRRFVFKIKFDYLTQEQNQLAFKHFFKLSPPPELDQIGGLTNGDYSTVKKKAIILDEMNNFKRLFEIKKNQLLNVFMK